MPWVSCSPASPGTSFRSAAACSATLPQASFFSGGGEERVARREVALAQRERLAELHGGRGASSPWRASTWPTRNGSSGSRGSSFCARSATSFARSRSFRWMATWASTL